ncbi:MAG TPA: sensor histidine kinase [Acidimicrobiales bacterium]|nr:sensor histidine kinase [Acidimicrobiales bacterium]
MIPPGASQGDLRPPFLHRITPRERQNIDYGVALLLVLLTALHASRRGAGPDRVETIVVALLAATSIALRRRYPLFALALLTAATCTVIVIQDQFFAEPLIALPVYQVATQYERRRSLLAVGLTCALVLLAVAVQLRVHTDGDIAGLALVASVAAWFVGDSVRARRTYVAGLAEQAAQRQREILERAQRSVAEERLQIARELHDVVAHSLSVIAVQSGVGRHVIDEHPAQAKRALAAVEATSRDALTELRRMLGVLRHDDDRPASLIPAPGVSSLAQLVDQVRAADVEVSLDVQSSRATGLSATADLAVYRIVQEALTNVVKHAGRATVSVEIRDELEGLVIEILDDGGGGVAPYPQPFDSLEEHHGIVGMRERVALFDGVFEARPRPEGGFRVFAKLPLVGIDAP